MANKTKKKSFDIEVCRTGYGFCTIRVKATSYAKAAQLALDEAGSHDFSENDAEYTVDGLDTGSGAEVTDNEIRKLQTSIIEFGRLTRISTDDIWDALKSVMK
jgi:hypothetical protein